MNAVREVRIPEDIIARSRQATMDHKKKFKESLLAVFKEIDEKRDNFSFTGEIYQKAFGVMPDETEDTWRTREAFERGRLMFLILYFKHKLGKELDDDDCTEYCRRRGLIKLQRERDTRENQKFEWEDLLWSV